ncbi:molybdopterin-dependent oxidoreductase [Roseicella frigidaeris]|uniref:Molybdopterin-binding oxidoreductase n=1 Tax=Roseicella frigidaeris TaxID=2230885 RepID=A0A327M3V8_9PROT|nr:molybdopterin-dependent oxidoreductase [Roseicella frigidaeris]RAI57951.1 molybdopterin-binding oxidoreductase [Roseicella frigidaeris]
MPLARLLLLLGLAAPWPALAQQLVLRGADGREVTLTAAEIAAMPHERQRLEAPGHAAAAFEGVPLGALLARLGAPQGQALRGPALALVVVARARDGYVVSFSLAETDPTLRPGGVFLADRRADGPLGPEEGPFRLVVPSEQRPARSARMIERIELRDMRATP